MDDQRHLAVANVDVSIGLSAAVSSRLVPGLPSNCCPLLPFRPPRPPMAQHEQKQWPRFVHYHTHQCLPLPLPPHRCYAVLCRHVAVTPSTTVATIVPSITVAIKPSITVAVALSIANALPKRRPLPLQLIRSLLSLSVPSIAVAVHHPQHHIALPPSMPKCRCCAVHHCRR